MEIPDTQAMDEISSFLEKMKKIHDANKDKFNLVLEKFQKTHNLTEGEHLLLLNAPQEDLPPEVIAYIDKIGPSSTMKLWLKAYEIEDTLIDQLRFKRDFELYPENGVLFIQRFFENFQSEFQRIKNIFLEKQRQEGLQAIKYFIEYLDNFSGNFLIQSEIDNYKRYFDDYIKVIDKELLKLLPPPSVSSETGSKKYTAKHYVLAYLFECDAKGEKRPTGNKTKLECIGDERMGERKGNTFYKRFNEIESKDINNENTLIEIGGEYWRKAVIELSQTPESVKKYLESKQL